jgi:hypothetical protein
MVQFVTCYVMAGGNQVYSHGPVNTFSSFEDAIQSTSTPPSAAGQRVIIQYLTDGGRKQNENGKIVWIES